MVSFTPNGLLDSRQPEANLEMRDAPQIGIFIPNGLLGASRDLTKDMDSEVDTETGASASDALPGALT